MGQGIAQVAAATGHTVRLFDTAEGRAKKAVESIASVLDKLVAKGKITKDARDATFSRLAPVESVNAACSDCALVIEAVPEEMALKVALFEHVVGAAPRDALLGSNTSSLSLTELGRRIGAPERTVGLHFFNPPPLMELLEIVRGLGTSDEAVERALAFAKAFGKTPIVVNDVPGFATSRLGVILGAEAIRMLETRVASAEDIDRAMELGYRHPMGPLKLTDLVGLDVRLASSITSTASSASSSARRRSCARWCAPENWGRRRARASISGRTARPSPSAERARGRRSSRRSLPRGARRRGAPRRAPRARRLLRSRASGRPPPR
jgi:3-hydroxybutyryl-CoA dehydrogenase